MRSFFTTFLTGVLAIASTYALPIADLAARTAYTPAIVSPDGSTVWGVGTAAVVSWCVALSNLLFRAIDRRSLRKGYHQGAQRR